ncbi:histone deacetylase 4-like [Heterodontus francisci]|uniref:histone deacetylase 4-like n=1 Tax=Heterodontus francisci TaxID=7792 RepID=UPI00355B08E9
MNFTARSDSAGAGLSFEKSGRRPRLSDTERVQRLNSVITKMLRLAGVWGQRLITDWREAVPLNRQPARILSSNLASIARRARARPSGCKLSLADARTPTADQPTQSAAMDLRIGQRYSKTASQAVSPEQAHRLIGLKHSHHQHQQLLLNRLQNCQEQFNTAQLDRRIKRSLEQSWEQERKIDHNEKLRMLWQKDKHKQSKGGESAGAVASSEVKQRLQEFVLRKQQAALKQSDTGGPAQTGASYMPPNLLCVQPDSPHSGASPSYDRLLTGRVELPGEYPLRKTASEPNLKLRLKLKQKASEKRRSPLLRRKDSAPASLRKRAPETRDPSPISSRVPSGPSSPNETLPSQNGTALSAHSISLENSLAHHLLMQEGSLIHLAVPNSPSLPNISQGLPAPVTSKGLAGEMERCGAASLNSRLPALDPPLLTGHSPVTYIPASALDREAGAARLQPLLILEPSMGQSPLLTVSGMRTLPVFCAAPLVASDRFGPRLAKLTHHRPLGRTQSAPLPQNPKSVQQQLHSQQLHQLFLERLKQQTHLGKLMSKRRLSHGEEGEGEKRGQGGGTPETPPTTANEGEEQQAAESKTEGSSRQSFRECSEAHLQQTSILWDQHWIQQVQQLPTRLETLGVPYPGHRQLSRTRSSPASASLPAPVSEVPSKSSFTTGISYDSLMLKHQCTCGNSSHLEHAGRIQSIWSRLQETGLRSQCECIRGRKATVEELQSVHTEQHVLLYGTNPLHRLKPDSHKLLGILSQRMFVMLPCGGLGVDSDTVWNEMHTSSAARMAVGCVLELAFKVASGKLKNGFAIVRPPGHHAEPSTAMGFCLFNSVAIAAKQLLQKSNVGKILIVDWDVHHGNGTQQVFYRDPNVLYISLHRHDNGNFFPGSGDADEVGCGPGEGFNVNIAWTGGLDPPMGDAEYLAAFR